MAERKPVVLVGGQLKELPAGDTLPPQAPASHSHATSDVTGLDAALSGKEPTISTGSTSQYLRGDKNWRDFFTDVRAATLTGLSTATNAVIDAADTVLAALGKLQKQISDHFASTANAHPASAIQLASDPTPLPGSLTAGTVQERMEEIFDSCHAVTTDLSSHKSEVFTQHPASVIGNTPAGNIAATDVQAAINELDTEKVSTSIGQVAGFRNKVINGDFKVWQRGTSFGAGSGIYTADRWAAAGATGQAITRVADHPVNGSSGYCINVVNTSGAQWIYQRIESINCIDLVGKQVTVSAWVKNVAAGPVGASIDVSHANAIDDYSATTAIGISSTTTSTSWTQLTYTFTMTVAMANGLQVRIITSGGAGGAATVRVAAVQLEVGPAATPFESRLYGAELALCQRYYCRFNTSNADSSFAMAFVGTTTQIVGMLKFPVSMRIAPNALEQSGAATDYAIAVPGANITCSAVPAYSARTTVDHGQFSFTVASGLTAGNAALAKSATTAAFLAFSAEL